MRVAALHPYQRSTPAMPQNEKDKFSQVEHTTLPNRAEAKPPTLQLVVKGTIPKMMML